MREQNLPQPKSIAALLYSSTTLSAAAGISVWLIIFWFAKESSYLEDDVTLLAPLFEGGIRQSLRSSLRPLEYLSAWVSKEAEAPIWLIVSCLAYSVHAALTYQLARTVLGREPPKWTVLLAATSPIAFQAYFQIDTVSQALANVFGTAYAICSIQLLRQESSSSPGPLAWRLLLLAACAVCSKETTYGLVFVGCAIVLMKHGRRVTFPIALILLLLTATVIASALLRSEQLMSGQSGYHLRFSPIYWIGGFGFLCTVASIPLPTSLVLTGTALQSVWTAALCIALLLAPIFLFAHVAGRKRQKVSFRELVRSCLARYDLILFVVAASVPSVFVKVGELYATQMSSLLVAAMVLAIVRFDSRRLWPLIGALAIAWTSASVVNAYYYSVRSGHRSDTDWPLAAAISSAARNPEMKYSIYAFGRDRSITSVLGCDYLNRLPNVCLPPTISASFPKRRENETERELTRDKRRQDQSH